MKLAVLCDLREENWPSMDLSGEELVRHAAALPDVELTRVLPRALYPALTERRARAPSGRLASNMLLAAERYLRYPAHAAALRGRHDCFHVVDHSYAHLLLALPAGRSGVYCHDIDAFRAALPGPAQRSGWRAALARLLISGLRRASVVFYSTPAVREDIEQHALVPSDRLVQAPFGIAAEFVASGPQSSPRLDLPPRYVLHVGSLTPRKNPDFLVEWFVRLAERQPDLAWVQVGGTFTEAHRRTLEQRGLGPRVRQLRGLSREELAETYRRAALVVLPSLAEGFGFPVLEALACGAVVLASDLPALRQVGGDAVVFRPPGSLEAWLDATSALLAGQNAPPLADRLEQTRRYSWAAHAGIVVEAYRRQMPNRV